MNNRDKSALSLALAIVGGIAAGMRCDASVTVETPTQINPRVAAYTVADPFVAKLDKRTEFAALKPKERKEVPEYKAAADQIAAVAEKAVAELRNKLDSKYKSDAAAFFPNEDIFMAIADDIGFDATGKPTKVNELNEISVALADFINEEAEA